MPRRVECFSTFLALDVGFDIRGLKVISEPCRALHPSLIVRLVSPNLYSKPASEHATQLCVDLGLIKVSEQICKGYSNFLRAAETILKPFNRVTCQQGLGQHLEKFQNALCTVDNRLHVTLAQLLPILCSSPGERLMTSVWSESLGPEV
jgi:hypothetical protein